MIVQREFVRRTVSAFAVACVLVLGACAGKGDIPAASAPTDIADPFEPVNRTVFGFNNALDTVIFRPVAVAYRTVIPSPIRQGVTNFLRHLRTPIIFANEVLQGDWEGAEVAATRFFVNTIVGLGGVIDIQGMTKGYEYRTEDFGQTLAVWGVGSGPYLVVPLFGPTTVRDATGTIVDGLADPFNLLANAKDAEEFIIARIVLSAIDARERNIEVIDELKQSIDYYAAVRTAYAQRRASQIRDGQVDPNTDFPSFDDLDDASSEIPTTVGESELAQFEFDLPPIGAVNDILATNAHERAQTTNLD